MDNLSARSGPGFQPTAAAVQHALEVDVVRVQFYQPVDAEIPLVFGLSRRMLSGFIRSDEPFALKTSFVLVWPVPDFARYSAYFYAHNLTTHYTIHLGAAHPVAFDDCAYTATLGDASLPAGLYRIQVLLQSPASSAQGGFEVPVLQVL